MHRVCKIDQRGCCGGLNASREIPALVDALERNRAGGLVVGCLQLNVDGVVRRNPTMHSLTEWNRQRNFGVKKTGGAFLPEIQKCFLQCMPFAAKPSAAEGRVVWLERPGIHLRLQVGIRRDLQRIEQRSSRKKRREPMPPYKRCLQTKYIKILFATKSIIEIFKPLRVQMRFLTLREMSYRQIWENWKMRNTNEYLMLKSNLEQCETPTNTE